MQPENWDDLRVFLAVARAKQIASAAAALSVDATTVSRRLRRLENSLGERLFEQTREGQVLTHYGESLVPKAESMEEDVSGLFRSEHSVRGLSGQVRLSVSEGFGSWFLAPRLARITREHPELSIELVANSGFLSPSKREADMAVMLSRPKAGPLITRKLADYSLMLYAAPPYLAEVGVPEKPRDLALTHRLVGYISDLIYAPELDYLSEIHSDLRATVKSSSINAQLQLIASGAGIGVLPCFMGDQDDRVQRVLPDVSVTRSFWIVTHKDNHGLAKIRHMTDWLVSQVREHARVLAPSATTN